MWYSQRVRAYVIDENMLKWAKEAKTKSNSNNFHNSWNWLFAMSA